MFSKSKNNDSVGENGVFNFFKGLIISIIVSLGLVAVFALCLKWFDIPDKFITPVTFVIKYLSVIVGSLVAVSGSKGFLKGGFFGLIYMSCSFVLFSFLAGSFSFDVSTILDFVSSILLGAIVGIIKVNRND